MDNFNLYAEYYDLLYKDKDYKGEVDYINLIINKHSETKVNKILELGCGTGIHANWFSKKGYAVDGVDISNKMINKAIENHPDNKQLNFYNGDITSFKNDNKYDAVISLFHVMSYQNSNEDIIKTFKTASDHLNKNGLFIFDFWYGPGVLTDLPSIRKKHLENNNIKVSRTATPKIHSEANVVDVDFNIKILNKETNNSYTVKEKHSMRYLFKPEIEYFLKHTEFQLIDFYQWLSFESPNLNSWNAVAIAKKI